MAGSDPRAGWGWILGIGDVVRGVLLGVWVRITGRGDCGASGGVRVPVGGAGAGVSGSRRWCTRERGVGDHAIVNTGSVVEHDCDVGENSQHAPRVGWACGAWADTLVGLGSSVLPGVWLGDGCVVGAGAVVLSNVTDGLVVVGVPARVMGDGRASP